MTGMQANFKQNSLGCSTLKFKIKKNSNHKMDNHNYVYANSNKKKCYTVYTN